MNSIKITTTQNIELEYDLASLGERMVGYLIDFLIIAAYCIVLLIAVSGSALFDQQQWLSFMLFFPVYFYDLASEVFMNGQSVGKRVMNIKVISLDGSSPTLVQYLIRWVFRLVDFPLTSYVGGLICVAVSERKQRIGDMVAGTTVIKTVARTSFQQTMYDSAGPEYKVTFPEVAVLGENDMQLIKEVIINVGNSGNLYLAHKAAAKIMHTLQIQSNMEPLAFLKVLLKDYNYLANQV